jgi:hypothetical protein
MAKIAQRQVVAEIIPNNEVGRKGPRFSGYFAQVSGGEITSAAEKVYDGGAKFPDLLCSTPEIGDVTITRPFDPDRDGSALKQIRQGVGNTYYDLTVYVLNCDLREAGTERVYAKALLVGLTEPEGDAASSAASTFTLTFSVGSVSAIS